ncbi:MULTISPECIES: hypothetical protein [unclassified Streptomyces]|uniref:hypothetical protein n=1 Tax=unclassified Streptomyces TaxID=2593676 RepID=UPI002256ACE6|nr:hypothetical protein [Streptomyces sp. NBC_00047]MCX5610355.1 hypothetical protein [Streptomyces sp. NBC_00047]
MSDDAEQRKARAEEIRRQIARARLGSPEPDSAPGEPREGESLKEAVERRMRELDDADRTAHPPPPDDGSER